MQTYASPIHLDTAYFSNIDVDPNGLPPEVKAALEEFKRITKGDWGNTDALRDPNSVSWFQSLSLEVIDAIITNPDGTPGYGLNFGFQQLLTTRQIDNLSRASTIAIFKTIASGGTQADISKFSRVTIGHMFDAMTQIRGDWVGVGPDGIWVWKLTATQVADLSDNQPDLGALLFQMWRGPSRNPVYADDPTFIRQFKALSSSSIDILINGNDGAPALGLDDKYLDLLTFKQFTGLTEKTLNDIGSRVSRLNNSLPEAQKLSLNSSPLLLYVYAITNSPKSQDLLTAWVGSLTESQVKTLSEDQVVSLGTYIAQLSPAVVAAMLPEQFFALTTDQLLAFTRSQYAGISAAQMAALPRGKVHAIHINLLSERAIGGLTAANINGIVDLRYFNEWSFGPAQIAAINPKAFAALDNVRLWAISKSNYKGITAAQLAALPIDKVHTIHIDWLSESAINGGLTAANINGIVDLRYFNEWSFGPAQIAAIHPDAFAALTPERIEAISPGNTGGITFKQLASLSAPQAQAISLKSIVLISPQTLAAAGSGFINRLSAAQVSKLTQAQVNAVIALLSPERFSQLASAERVNLISVAAWEKVSQAQMSALLPEAFAALVPAQMGALSRSALGGLTQAQMNARYPLGSQRADQDLEALSVIASQREQPLRRLMELDSIADVNAWMSMPSIPGLMEIIQSNSSSQSKPPESKGDKWVNYETSDGYGSHQGGSQVNSGLYEKPITAQDLLDANSDQIWAWRIHSSSSLEVVMLSLTATQVAQLRDSQLAALGGFLRELPIAAISGLNSAVIGSIDPDYLTNAQLAAMSQSQVQALNLVGVAPYRLVELGMGFIDYLAPGQLSSGQVFQLLPRLTPAQISTSSLQFMLGLTPVEMAYTFSHVGGNYLAALSASQLNLIFGSFTPAYVDLLASRGNTQDLAIIETFAGLVLPARYALLTPATVVSLSPMVLGSLLPTQIAALDISRLGGAAMARAGVRFLNGLSNAQVLSLNVSSQLIDILRNLTPSNFAQINPSFFRALPTAALAVALNFIRTYPSYSAEQFAPLMAALTADQANAIFGQLTNTYVEGLPSEYTPQATNLAGLIQFLSHLPKAVYSNLSLATLAALSPTLFNQLPIAHIDAANLVNSLITAGPFALLQLSTTQISELTITQIDGLLTSGAHLANVMLNVEAINTWSSEQFEAMLAIPGVIASLNPTVLGNSLSVNALLNLTEAQIGQLTGAQWQAILNNPTLSKVAFNAGQGAGYWGLAQLQAVSSAAIPYMAQDQYLQFNDGLAMFSQAQQSAMTRNVALLEIMLTGRTDGWTQDQIARVVNTVPEMIPLSGLPGGGGCFSNVRQNVGERFEINGIAAMHSSELMAAILTQTIFNQGFAEVSLIPRSVITEIFSHALFIDRLAVGLLFPINQDQDDTPLIRSEVFWNFMNALSDEQIAVLPPALLRNLTNINLEYLVNHQVAFVERLVRLNPAMWKAIPVGAFEKLYTTALDSIFNSSVILRAMECDRLRALIDTQSSGDRQVFFVKMKKALENAGVRLDVLFVPALKNALNQFEKNNEKLKILSEIFLDDYIVLSNYNEAFLKLKLVEFKLETMSFVDASVREDLRTLSVSNGLIERWNKKQENARANVFSRAYVLSVLQHEMAHVWWEVSNSGIAYVHGLQNDLRQSLLNRTSSQNPFFIDLTQYLFANAKNVVTNEANSLFTEYNTFVRYINQSEYNDLYDNYFLKEYDKIFGVNIFAVVRNEVSAHRLSVNEQNTIEDTESNRNILFQIMGNKGYFLRQNICNLIQGLYIAVVALKEPAINLDFQIDYDRILHESQISPSVFLERLARSDPEVKLVLEHKFMRSGYKIRDVYSGLEAIYTPQYNNDGLNGVQVVIRGSDATESLTTISAPQNPAELIFSGLRVIRIINPDSIGGPASLLNQLPPVNIQFIAYQDLSALTRVQANRISNTFWQNITVSQLTTIINSETLGVVGYFDIDGTEGHISTANLASIPPAVLVAAYENATMKFREQILGARAYLSAGQLKAFQESNQPGFNAIVQPPQNQALDRLLQAMAIAPSSAGTLVTASTGSFFTTSGVHNSLTVSSAAL
jgi:hypothetical protein